MSDQKPLKHKGRAAVSNETGRFETLKREDFDDGWGQDEQLQPLKTNVTDEVTKNILSSNTSPDVPFNLSLNPYKGCEHGCIYCFARPTHTYLGLSAGLDFESRLFAKPDAATRLAAAWRQPAYKCQVIALGANTDAYQPIERKRQITRSVLQVFAEFRHPLVIITKSALIERDLDLLSELAKDQLVNVCISVTTLDRSLARKLEPRAAAPERRLQTIERLSSAGIPCCALVAPIIPGLTDQELETILQACTQAGARWANYVLLRLPHEVQPLFEEWLQTHEPGKAKKIMHLIAAMRGGKAYDARFGTRMTGTGIYAELIRRRFDIACDRLSLNQTDLALNTQMFKVPGKTEQLSLF